MVFSPTFPLLTTSSRGKRTGRKFSRKMEIDGSDFQVVLIEQTNYQNLQILQVLIICCIFAL